MGSFLAGEPGADDLDEGRAGNGDYVLVGRTKPGLHQRAVVVVDDFGLATFQAPQFRMELLVRVSSGRLDLNWPKHCLDITPRHPNPDHAPRRPQAQPVVLPRQVGAHEDQQQGSDPDRR
jgi:hypothetical protein